MQDMQEQLKVPLQSPWKIFLCAGFLLKIKWSQVLHKPKHHSRYNCQGLREVRLSSCSVFVRTSENTLLTFTKKGKKILVNTTSNIHGKDIPSGGAS